MNPNYLEYERSVVKTYISKYQNIIAKDFEYVREINKHIYATFKKNDITKVIYKRSEKFVSRYNNVVDLIEEGERKGCIGKYRKLFIKKRFGTKRTVYEPEAQFKFILSKFADILEYVLFDTFSTRNRYKKIDLITTEDVRCDVLPNGKNGLSYIPQKNIVASNRSVNNVLYSMGHTMAKLLTNNTTASYLYIHKFDIKDAFTSTKLHLVKQLIAAKLKGGKLCDFILKHIDMCFVDGSLPPGYPTSNVIFGFVKDLMCSRFICFLQKETHGNFFSYVDDFYYVDSNPRSHETVNKFKKYIRRWGYRTNINKSKIIVISKNKIGKQGYTIPEKILGKVATIGSHLGFYRFRVYWNGSRQVKNKIRMLDYLLKKVKDSKHQVDTSKDSENVLVQRKEGLKQFYFPEVGSCTYRAQ